MEASQKYIPGVCNIGRAEIQTRKRVGWTGLIVTVLIWTGFGYWNLAGAWFLLLFFPAAMSATGFIQGYSQFCAGFGMRGLFNFNEMGKTDTVSQAEFRAKDKKKALRIFAYSVLIGLLIAIIAAVVR